MKFALERAIREQKKRIIYVLPYNSIIEQTAEIFENIFGDDAEILRHQSTFSIEDDLIGEESDKQIAKMATENWDAQIIITTAVQFFESLYSNKRGKLRKLHNMGEVIFVFDEVHTMPLEYLHPCLEGISFLVKYFQSEAVFLTATMPDFVHWMKDHVMPSLVFRELVTDNSLFRIFQKCSYQYIQSISPVSYTHLDVYKRQEKNFWELGKSKGILPYMIWCFLKIIVSQWIGSSLFCRRCLSISVPKKCWKTPTMSLGKK